MIIALEIKHRDKTTNISDKLSSKALSITNINKRKSILRARASKKDTYLWYHLTKGGASFGSLTTFSNSLLRDLIFFSKGLFFSPA